MKPLKKSKNEKKLEHELLWIIGFIALLVVIYLIASFYFRQRNYIEYQGLTFTKEKFGELPVYHYYYYFNTSTGKIIKYNLYLKEDPRENNLTLEGGPIIFDKKKAYIAVDPLKGTLCEDELAAIVDLAQFLTDNQVVTRSGVLDQNYSEENELEYVTCLNKQSSEVIEFRSGNTTKIVIDGNCHTIYIGPECRAMSAVEKLKVQIILDAKNVTS